MSILNTLEVTGHNGQLELTDTVLRIKRKVGALWAVTFFVGTFLSVTLSVAFSILVFNAVSFFFLHASSQEVIDYLRTLFE